MSARAAAGRVLRLIALLATAVVVTMRPLFRGIAPDFFLTVLTVGLQLLALCFLLASCVAEGKSSLRITLLHPALLILAIAAFWGASRADWQSEAVLSSLNLVSLLLTLFLVAELGIGWRHGQLFLFLLLTSSFLAIAVGLYQHFQWFDKFLGEISTRPDLAARKLMVSPEHWPDVKARIETREIYSTFLLSNTFAGYLLLILPVMAGYCMDYMAATKRITERLAGMIYLLMPAAGIAALWQTGSRAAWIALGGAALTGPLITFVWPRMRRLWPVLLLMACFSAGILLWWLGHADVEHRVVRNDSLGVRLGYWQGTLGVIGKHPLRGVGIGRFPDHYLQMKSASAQEVRIPHSMWLEVWVEMGLLGLLAVICVMAASMWIALEGTFCPSGRGSNRPRGRGGNLIYVGITGVAAFAILRWFSADFQSALWWKMGALWLMTAAFFICSSPACLLAEPGKGMRWALPIGVIAFALHASVDIDFQSPAITTALVVLVIAIAGNPSAASQRMRMPRSLMVVATALCLLLLLGFVGRLALPLVRIQRGKLSAEQLKFVGEYEKAINQLEPLLVLNPKDTGLLMHLATLYTKRAKLNPATRTNDFRRTERLWRKFIFLRPQFVRGYYELANLYHWRGESDPSYLLRAEKNYLKARALYPTLPILRIHLALVYEKLGRMRAAYAEYREALCLNSLVTQRVRRLTVEQIANVKKRLRRLRQEDDQTITHDNSTADVSCKPSKTDLIPSEWRCRIGI